MTKLDIIYKIAQMQETLNQVMRAVVDLEEVEVDPIDNIPEENFKGLRELLKVKPGGKDA